MIIKAEGSYIFRGQTWMGETYHHLYLVAGYDTDSHSLLGDVMTGPHPDPDTAWSEFRAKLHPSHPMSLPKVL